MKKNTDDIINREAGDKTKGFRLQKLRAVHLALEKIAENRNANVYCATEMTGDVYIYCGDSLWSKEVVEENKDYDPAKAFTLNNDRVRNTLVLFLDVWRRKEFSKNLYFSFYTTARIGREKRVGLLQYVEIPDEGLLNSVASGNDLGGQVLVAVKSIVCEEFNRQYSGMGSFKIEEMSDEMWIDFFSRIKWSFDQLNEVELEGLVIQQIKDFEDYAADMQKGFESFILAKLIDEIDKKQSCTDYFERILTNSDIRYIFLYAERGKYQPDDPSWVNYDSIELSDKRNLREKFLFACSGYPDEKLKGQVRKVLSSKAEQNHFKGDNSLKAMMYRIYDQSVDYIIELKKGPYTSSEIDEHLSELTKRAVAVIDECSRDYRYPIRNSNSIHNMLLDLFESCYLSFENGADPDEH